MEVRNAKVYISGPITGYSDYFEYFGKAETMLKNLGFEVMNPSKLNLIMPNSTSWQGYMDLALCMLRQCDIIFMLEGWENSKGATIEYNYAIGKNMDIMFQKDINLK